MRENIDIGSLPLHDLLSAPLSAAIEAQVQTSLGLVSLIQDLGFDTSNQQQDVRTVEFRYARDGLDAEGRPAKIETCLRIPLLAMIALPNLEIGSITVNVLAKTQTGKASEQSPLLKLPNTLKDRYPFLLSRPSLRVAPTSRTLAKGAPQTTRPYDLEISFNASSEEHPDGIQRVLTTISSLIMETER
ncbi:MAG: DUF2589 domain-containing protein [Nitrospirae bacterium]|nr:MAG: DUF2589 domain-containing protein [Nitrospirota bacterium]